MPPKARANAFSSAGAQAAVLDEWKKRSAKHQETANSLQRKVRRLKRDSEAVRRAALWMQERDSLNCEQEACEADLAAWTANLRSLVDDAAHRERQAELAALKTLLLQQLREVGALGGGSSRARQAFADEPRYRQRVEQLRGWVATERAEADAAAAVAQLQPGGTPDVLEAVAAELGVVASSASDRLAALRTTYDPPADLHDLFASALISAAAEARGRLEAQRQACATPVEDSMLATVCLVLRMAHQARQFDLSATTRTALLERVTAVFPDVPASRLQAMVDRGLAMRSAHASARATVADFRRSVAALLADGEAAFQLARQAEEDRMARAAAARQRSAEQADRHARLAESRAAHEATVQQRRSVLEERQQAAAAKAAVQQSRLAAEFQDRLRLLEAYMEQRRRLQHKERELQETRARALAEEKAARMRHNGERVEFRRQEEEQRRSAQREQEAEVQALQAQKQRALSRFFAAVDKQLGVEADPQRVLKATVSSAQTESYETLAQTTQTPLAGFSDETIMKDPRVRLYHALLAAGLHTTSYGREVVTRGYHVAPSQMSSENNPLRGQFS